MIPLAPLKFLNDFYHLLYIKYKDEGLIVRFEIDKDTPPEHVKLFVFTKYFWQSFIVEDDDFKDIDKLIEFCMGKIEILYKNIEWQEWLLDHCFKDRKILPDSVIGELLCDEDYGYDHIVSKFIESDGDEYGYTWNVRIPTINPTYSPSSSCESWTEVGKVIRNYFEGLEMQIEKYFVEKEKREENVR